VPFRTGTCWTGGVGDEAAGGCRDVGCRCRWMLCPFPLQLMIQVREQRCARSLLSGGTRSKVVDSILAVASVVRTAVVVVVSRRGHQYVGRGIIVRYPSHINNILQALIGCTTSLPHKYYNCNWSLEMYN
jgi:hypothetical protein